MSPITLTQRQQEILQTLIGRYRATECPVPRETLAAALDCPPATIDRQIKLFKARQLVESFSGPTGGYRPTARTYEVLASQEIEQPAATPVMHDGQRVEGVLVQEIAFPAVHDPTRCHAMIRLDESLPDIAPGEPISVSPTPLSKLRVAGTVAETSPATASLLLTIDALHAPAKRPDGQAN